MAQVLGQGDWSRKLKADISKNSAVLSRSALAERGCSSRITRRHSSAVLQEEQASGDGRPAFAKALAGKAGDRRCQGVTVKRHKGMKTVILLYKLFQSD